MGQAAVRYPRGTGTGAVIDKTMTALPIGKGLMKREGSKVAILNFGTLLGSALEAGRATGCHCCGYALC
jgi:1-deoxy-D-xylulose-5-phosphate synthase